MTSQLCVSVRALPGAVIFAATLLGCGPYYGGIYIATDGAAFLGDATLWDAVRASSVHDLPCSRNAVSMQRLPGGSRGPTEIMADGCGQRVIYRLTDEWHDERGVQALRHRLILTGHFPLPPAAPAGTP